MNDYLLEMRDLRIETIVDSRKKRAKPTEILKGIDLTLRRGEVVGLIGESGAGKSTIGLAAMGYARRGLRLSSGEIWLDGQQILGGSVAQLAQLRGQKVAYVAQSAAASFNPAHRLLAQVLEVTKIHKHMNTAKAEKRAVELFARMGLPHPEAFGMRYPHEVSGGQLQRAMTAMALAGEPDLIVFDEPTTALDVTTQIDVLAIIKEVIQEYKTAALYITHDLGVVAQISDRIKVLKNGAEVEEQATESLLNAPQNAYTKELLNVRSTVIETELSDDEPVALGAEGIDASYGTVQVLNDVSVALKRGSNLAIVGESGSGKSTLARVIMGLLPPSKGTLSYNDQPLSSGLSDRTASQRKSIQMIYQLPDVAMNPRQTIAEIIGRPAQVFVGMSKQNTLNRVHELLHLVDLPVEMAQAYPNQLSGGQKQRVCIARALAAEPDVIICDEVTSALDPLVADGIIELLLKLQRKFGISYIFITHDMAMVRAIANDVVVMKAGTVVEQGAKARVFAPPFNDYTHLLMSSTPEMRVGWLENVLTERRMEAGGQ
ncbi:ABC transporter ATP-binding protein [Cochlodiniinecator piscidefendens]|uniref:ABC transporter ATP-binding protein n=1 Tax=Cochlodiniinecator piscidefendens TaxID=2715756 RepID=UPI001408A6F6|nr:ABC transporter ATP-binding protein [Cochlodiniinecator piscidefendens]